MATVLEAPSVVKVDPHPVIFQFYKSFGQKNGRPFAVLFCFFFTWIRRLWNPTFSCLEFSRDLEVALGLRDRLVLCIGTMVSWQWQCDT